MSTDDKRGTTETITDCHRPSPCKPSDAEPDSYDEVTYPDCDSLKARVEELEAALVNHAQDVGVPDVLAANYRLEAAEKRIAKLEAENAGLRKRLANVRDLIPPLHHHNDAAKCFYCKLSAAMEDET